MAGSGIPTHEKGYAEHAFVPDDSNFCRRAILHDIEQGNDGRCGEIDVPQSGARFVEDLSRSKVLKLCGSTPTPGYDRKA